MTSATRPRARSAPARLGEAALRSVREAAPRALAALGALLAGYDLGLLAGFLATESFVYDYCVDWHNFLREDCKAPLAELPAAWTALLARFVAAHLAGCLAGALLAPRLADRFGRRPVIVGAALLFCAAAGGTLYSPPHWRRMLLWIRAAQGLAVGALSAALSLLAAELAPPAARKRLEHSARLAAAAGLVLANGTNLVMERRLHGWRRANGAAALPVLAALLAVWLVPESPAWVLARRGRDAAEKVLRRLRRSPKAAQLELEQLALQAADAAKAAQLAAHRPVNYKPLLTAALLEVLRQATGVGAVLTFGALVFQDVARAGFRAAALLSLAYLLGAALADQCRRALGRRRLLLLGAAGMAAAHCATAAGYRVLCAQDAALPDDARCSDAAGWLLCWTTAAFVCCFAASWGSATLSQSLDSEESAALQSCGPALSTVAALGSGAAVAHAAALLLPRAPLGDLFFVLAWLCGYAGLFVYVFCPERGPLDPKGRQQPSTAAGSLLKIV